MHNGHIHRERGGGCVDEEVGSMILGPEHTPVRGSSWLDGDPTARGPRRVGHGVHDGIVNLACRDVPRGQEVVSAGIETSVAADALLARKELGVGRAPQAEAHGDRELPGTEPEVREAWYDCEELRCSAAAVQAAQPSSLASSCDVQ